VGHLVQPPCRRSFRGTNRDPVGRTFQIDAQPNGEPTTTPDNVGLMVICARGQNPCLVNTWRERIALILPRRYRGRDKTSREQQDAGPSAPASWRRLQTPTRLKTLTSSQMGPLREPG